MQTTWAAVVCERGPAGTGRVARDTRRELTDPTSMTTHCPARRAPRRVLETEITARLRNSTTEKRECENRS